MLTEEGYKNFSLRKLARRCKVSHTSPYRHFEDKNALILAIAREIQEKFNTALKGSLENMQGTQRDKVKAMGRRYVYFFLENPDYLEILFLTPELQEISPQQHKHEEGSSFETYLSAVIPLLSDESKGKRDIPMDPSALDGRIPGDLLQPWCLIHGLTVLLVKKAIPLTSHEKIDTLINEVLAFIN